VLGLGAPSSVLIAILLPSSPIHEKVHVDVVSLRGRGTHLYVHWVPSLTREMVRLRRARVHGSVVCSGLRVGEMAAYKDRDALYGYYYLCICKTAEVGHISFKSKVYCKA